MGLKVNRSRFITVPSIVPKFAHWHALAVTTVMASCTCTLTPRTGDGMSLECMLVIMSTEKRRFRLNVYSARTISTDITRLSYPKSIYTPGRTFRFKTRINRCHLLYRELIANSDTHVPSRSPPKDPKLPARPLGSSESFERGESSNHVVQVLPPAQNQARGNVLQQPESFAFLEKLVLQCISMTRLGMNVPPRACRDQPTR